MMEVEYRRETTLTGAVVDETPVSVFVMGPLGDVVISLPVAQVSQLFFIVNYLNYG